MFTAYRGQSHITCVHIQETYMLVITLPQHNSLNLEKKNEIQPNFWSSNKSKWEISKSWFSIMVDTTQTCCFCITHMKWYMHLTEHGYSIRSRSHLVILDISIFSSYIALIHLLFQIENQIFLQVFLHHLFPDLPQLPHFLFNELLNC